METFLSRLHKALSITPSIDFLNWLKKVDTWYIKKKVRDKLLKNKQRQAHKQEARPKEVVYLEHTKDIKGGTYATGILCNSGTPQAKDKKDKPASSGKTKRTRQPCDCGEGDVYYSSLYWHCDCNQKNKQKKAVANAMKNTNEIVTSSHTNYVTHTTKLT